MSTNYIRQEHDGRVLQITLQRTEKRNALTGAMCAELVSALTAAGDDPGIGAVLLTAEGPAFCAGMDLEETIQPAAAETTAIHEQLFTIATRMPKPIIAAVQGTAAGGGVGLVANAHIVLAADNATFGLTEIRLAMWPYVIYRALVTAMGPRRTLELSLTGRLFSAAQAQTYGLVHEILPDSGLLSRSRELARTIAQSSSEGLRRGLAFAHQSAELCHDEAGVLALARRAEVFTSEDFREGVRAFQEKRPPRWPSNG